ncbi:DUF1365 domain-containing protein [Nocardia sp. NPDC004151]|uniref:DUF1365 domain-containing protein n=1 Tax=Nocardia sp. NPDC004151 TaxID=3364304 RepID=UPI0036BA8E0C
MTRARLVRTVIHHTRLAPVRHAFTYRSYSWLVDLDELPALSWPWRCLASFRARDHLGDPAATLRANVIDYLAAAGIELGDGRILMLANARVLGYVFNPLTVYWCHDANGTLRWVIAEVHNTYGERHRYVAPARPEAIVAKEFYVSPFTPAAGRYRLRAPEPTDRLRVAITLEGTDGRAVFAGTVSGQVLPANRRTVARVLAAHPVETLRVTALIRWQGLRLWRRGLPITARPSAASREVLT